MVVKDGKTAKRVERLLKRPGDAKHAAKAAKVAEAAFDTIRRPYLPTSVGLLDCASRDRGSGRDRRPPKSHLGMAVGKPNTCV